MTPVDMGRYFFALCPQEGIRQQCFDMAARHVPSAARPVPYDNLHATLIFIGQQPLSMLDQLTGIGDQVSAKRFTLALDHLKIFKRSRVLCLCPSHTPETLLALHQQLKVLLEDIDIHTEARAYRPHVTLARKVTDNMEFPDIKKIEWHVKSFSLMQSVSGKNGVRYPVIKHWQLTEAS